MKTSSVSLPSPAPSLARDDAKNLHRVRPQRNSAFNATNEISKIYQPGGILDSQQDSQTWFKGLEVNAEDTGPRSDSRNDNLSNSSEIEFVDQEDCSPPLKKPKLSSKGLFEPKSQHVSNLRKSAEIVALEFEELWEERCELIQNLNTTKTELVQAKEDLITALRKVDEMEKDLHHLRLTALTIGEKLIDHGPGKLKCLCIHK
ncbi:hypothetical protein H0H92_006616 [Tricholoma furcatifolium]|nr:hypothetical protein H0H92_006616 [Tricholoma furcatifolium]